MQALDSLMQQRPDSALALLRSDVARNDSTTEYDRHYAQLLLAEALYKNDQAQTNREDVLEAVRYFDSLADTRGVSLHGSGRRDASDVSAQTIAFLAARAHYINGVGHYERDSIVAACREYLTALEVMESHFGEKDLVGQKAKFMALTYTRLTELFADFYLHEQAIYFGKQSLAYYVKHDDSTWYIPFMIGEIGSHYDMMEEYDSADFYYQKSLTVLTDTNDLIYRDITTHLAFLDYKTGKGSEPSLTTLKNLVRQTVNKQEQLSRYLIVGDIYYHENLFDSALVYFNHVFQESQNEELKKQDAELLVEILKTQGRESEILNMRNFWCHTPI